MFYTLNLVIGENKYWNESNYVQTTQTVAAFLATHASNKLHLS